MNPLALNTNTTAFTMRFIASWRGAWQVDAEIDADTPPSGGVTFNAFDQDLVGTVDPTATAIFADRVKVCIVGGKNGWNQPVATRDYHNDANVTASAVITTTAAEVGETVADLPSQVLGVDYVRSAGVASRVLSGLDWYVDFAGVTHVTARPTVTTIPDDIVVEDYDPLTRTLVLTAVSSLVVPGMSFTDPNGRWSGALIVRDVEQHFTGDGESHAIALCASEPASRDPLALLQRLIAESTNILYARSYRYRIVTQDVDGRVELQAVNPTPGLPDVLPLSVWPGAPGMTAKYQLDGSVVRVSFLEGTPAIPVVTGFDPGVVPMSIDFAATLQVSLTAAIVQLGGDGALPIALAGPLLLILQAIGVEMTADIALLSNPPTSIMFAAYAPAKAALLTTLASAIVAQLANIPTENTIAK